MRRRRTNPKDLHVYRKPDRGNPPMTPVGVTRYLLTSVSIDLRPRWGRFQIWFIAPLRIRKLLVSSANPEDL